jgi:hypothetical protein
VANDSVISFRNPFNRATASGQHTYCRADHTGKTPVKIILTGLAALFAAVSAAVPALAQPPAMSARPAPTLDPDIASLRGLVTLSVVVEELAPTAAQNGITRESLETIIEQRLRQSGIRVVDNPASDATLYLRITFLVRATTKGTPLGAVYHAGLELQQIARLEKNQAWAYPTSWRTGDLVVHAVDGIAENVRFQLNQQMDKFLTAYLAANPQ